MDRKTAEREAARIVREATEFTASRCDGTLGPHDKAWFLVGVLQTEIATLLERKDHAESQSSVE